ncbi:MAG: adenylate kinase [Kiritimatiellae bacterium]|nr:adenylate kinase [Kiritimatiellia bacterium]
MQTIILLGPPGVGKGTAAQGLMRSADFTHVSTGDMLREAIKSGTSLGKIAKAYMDKGELVPDEVIMEIVQKRLNQGLSAAKYMFDGFPRTLEQARLFDALLVSKQTQLTKVFILDATREILLERLAGRRICKNCGAVYHVKRKPPKQEGICDHCQGEVYQRIDDKEKTILNRLAIFRKQTEGLIDYYKNRDLVIRIDARQDPEVIKAIILEALDIHDKD